MNYDKKPVKIGDLIEPVADSLGLLDRYNLGRIQSAWPKIVGEKIAKSTKFEKFQNGKLFLRVNSSTWKAELNLRKESIKDEINRQLNKVLVKEIIFW